MRLAVCFVVVGFSLSPPCCMVLFPHLTVSSSSSSLLPLFLSAFLLFRAAQSRGCNRAMGPRVCKVHHACPHGPAQDPWLRHHQSCSCRHTTNHPVPPRVPTHVVRFPRCGRARVLLCAAAHARHAHHKRRLGCRVHPGERWPCPWPPPRSLCAPLPLALNVFSVVCCLACTGRRARGWSIGLGRAGPRPAVQQPHILAACANCPLQCRRARAECRAAHHTRTRTRRQRSRRAAARS